jgi:hypothetical protein
MWRESQFSSRVGHGGKRSPLRGLQVTFPWSRTERHLSTGWKACATGIFRFCGSLAAWVPTSWWGPTWPAKLLPGKGNHAVPADWQDYEDVPKQGVGENGIPKQELGNQVFMPILRPQSNESVEPPPLWWRRLPACAAHRQDAGATRNFLYQLQDWSPFCYTTESVMRVSKTLLLLRSERGRSP